jgi:hypothetical protein
MELRGGTVAEDEGEQWWTIPQAAVWIRTRDLESVQALDVRQRTSLFVAADAIPGLFPAATECLREALRRGRLAARGRLALRELAVPDGQPAWRLLDDGPQLVPETFWQSGGDFGDDPDLGVVAAAPGEPERWTDLAVNVDDCVGHWQAPASLLGHGRLPMSQVLPNEPDDVPQWLLAHPEVVVTGVDGSGARVAIERGMLGYPLLIDRDNGVLTTADGQLTWRAVELELATVPMADRSAEHGKLRSRRRPGQKGHQRTAAKAYLEQAYPDGVPASISLSAIEAELRAKGIFVSPRTIRRAMGGR